MSRSLCYRHFSGKLLSGIAGFASGLGVLNADGA
jgi:hypothetical protein